MRGFSEQYLRTRRTNSIALNALKCDTAIHNNHSTVCLVLYNVTPKHPCPQSLELLGISICVSIDRDRIHLIINFVLQNEPTTQNMKTLNRLSGS